MSTATLTNGKNKILPSEFMGAEVVTAVRVPHREGLCKHRGLIIREYPEETYRDGVWNIVNLYSVHWVLAQKDDDKWDGWMGDYDFRSFSDAFLELERRLTREEMLAPF